MDSAKLVKIHINIAKIRIIYLVIFVLYELIMLQIGVREVEIWLLAYSLFVMMLIVLDYIMALKKYYNNFKIIRWIRTLLAMCFSMNIILSVHNVYFSSLSMFVFSSLVMQTLYLTNISRFRNKLMYFFAIVSPMIVVSIIRIMQINTISFMVRTIAFNLLLISIMTVYITFVSHIFTENKLENRRLSLELLKFKKNDNEDGAKTEFELENAYEKLSRENSEMLIENLIQQYISSSLEISNLMKLILESLSEALVVNLCSIIVKGEEHEAYQYDTRHISNNVNIEYFNMHIENGTLIEQFKDLKKPFVDNQVNVDEYYFLEGTTIKSLLIYPLMNENEWLGMLVIGKDMNDYFLANMSFFERVSTQFSIALTNARTYTRMEDKAMKDGLTGIYNRTYMIQKFNEYISSAVLKKSSLSIMLFDIDKFKIINDQYGHLFGDEVIRVCANIVKNTVQKHTGFVARYGGEEFVIVLKEGSLEELSMIASELHNQIKKTQISYRGDSLFVDVSIGVAAYPTTCDNPAELIDRADKAMYHSKGIGRGCISFDGKYTD